MMTKKLSAWVALIIVVVAFSWVILIPGVGGKAASPTTPLISAVQITNVRDTAFTVSWVTDQAVTGEVHYSTNPVNVNQIALDDRGGETSDDIHYVTIQGLTPNTLYHFDLVVGATTYDNDGIPYTVTTGPTLEVPSSDAIFGQVFKADGVTPAEGVMVYVTLFDNDGLGSPERAARLSSLTDETGFWHVNLGNTRTIDLNQYFDYLAEGDGVELTVEGAGEGEGSQTVSPIGDNPLPSIILTEPSSVLPASVTISGPTAGSLKKSYSFIASVSPITSTQPLSYIWQATEQSPITNTNGLSDTVSFTWNFTGTQVITVTALNTGGMVTNTHAITITDPTAVTLVAFTATAKGDDVHLTWETAAEIDNAGFNLWRSIMAEGEYAKINSALIPAQGSIDIGVKYEYVDSDLTKAGTYYYKLEDIDVNGLSAFHGPVSVTAIPPVYLPVVRK